MINEKYMMIQEQIDRIVENLADVYATGCIGYVMIYADGKVVDFEHKWISKEAKDNYDLMQLKLKLLLEDQNRILGHTAKLKSDDILAAGEAEQMLFKAFKAEFTNQLNKSLKEQFNDHSND